MPSPALSVHPIRSRDQTWLDDFPAPVGAFAFRSPYDPPRLTLWILAYRDTDLRSSDSLYLTFSLTKLRCPGFRLGFPRRLLSQLAGSQFIRALLTRLTKITLSSLPDPLCPIFQSGSAGRHPDSGVTLPLSVYLRSAFTYAPASRLPGSLEKPS